MIGARQLLHIRNGLAADQRVPREVVNGAWEWLLVPGHVSVVSVPYDEMILDAEGNKRPRFETIQLKHSVPLAGKLPLCDELRFGWGEKAGVVVWQVL